MSVALLLLMAQSPDDTPWLPSEDDVGRFPSGEIAEIQMKRYQQHLAWVEWQARQPVLDARFGRDYWQAVRVHTQRNLDCWELLTYARNMGSRQRQNAAQVAAFRRWWGIPVRAYLDQLRDRLGDADYAAARMPPRLPSKGALRVPKVANNNK